MKNNKTKFLQHQKTYFKNIQYYCFSYSFSFFYFSFTSVIITILIAVIIINIFTIIIDVLLYLFILFNLTLFNFTSFESLLTGLCASAFLCLWLCFFVLMCIHMLGFLTSQTVCIYVAVAVCVSIFVNAYNTLPNFWPTGP